MRWRQLLTALIVLTALAAGGLIWLAWQSPAAWPKPAVVPPELAMAQGLQPGQPLWARVNDELWQLDPSGRLVRKTPWTSLGLPGRPSSLQVDARGHLLLWVPGHARIWTVAPDPLKVLGSRDLAWPAQVRPGLDSTRHASVHADGRVAVCHGPSGRVLVFQPDGRLWAITADGSSRLCGALWWEDDDLWVSQTLDQGLVHLRSDTLDPIGHVRARPAWPAGSEILSVNRHPRHGIDVHAPLATVLVREPEGRSVHLLHLWPDGMSIEQPLERQSQPQDAIWRGEELLMADAQALDWRRFDIDRQPLPGLADASTSAQLRRQFAPTPPSGPPPRQQRLDQALTVATLAVALLLLRVFSAPVAERPVTDAAGSVTPGPVDPYATWQERWCQRAGRRHLRRLRVHEKLSGQGERLREAFFLKHPDGQWWILLSNRRLLQYRLDGGRLTPILQCSRSDLAQVRLTLPAAGRPWQASHLRIELIDGHVISGRLRPASLARRVAAMLQIKASGGTEPPSGTAAQNA